MERLHSFYGSYTTKYGSAGLKGSDIIKAFSLTKEEKLGMSLWDFLLSEYSFIISVITTLIGWWLSIYAEKLGRDKLEKIGKTIMIVFALLSIGLLIGRFSQVSEDKGTIQTETKSETELQQLETESDSSKAEDPYTDVDEHTTEESVNHDIIDTEEEIDTHTNTFETESENTRTPQSIENVLQIAEIPEVYFEGTPIVAAETSILNKEIQVINGSIEVEGQFNDYVYMPTLDGTYRLEFANVPEGVDFALLVYNSGGEKLYSKSDLDDGDGMTLSLKAGISYTIRVKQYKSFGTYTLNIGQQNEIRDISVFTKVFDAVQYTDQRNKYSFSPEYSGLYRFDFSDVPEGTDLKIYIYNSGWELISSKADLDNGDGLSISLSSEKMYYVCVEQYAGIGSYILNIGHKKYTNDITGYTRIRDTIQYNDQQNDYRYIPSISGLYRFGFSNVPEGTDLKLYIYNSGMELISSKADMDSGVGILCELTAGNLYYIRVEQYEKVGNYDLEIGTKKQILDISLYDAVKDSVQYLGQENDYLFTPTMSGKYRFKFSDVPEGTDLKVYIYNSGWENIGSKADMDNDDSILVDLNAGSTYYIRVKQYEGCGWYKLLWEVE